MLVIPYGSLRFLTVPSFSSCNITFLNDIATDFIPMLIDDVAGQTALDIQQLQFIANEFVDVEENMEQIHVAANSLALLHSAFANVTPFWRPDLRRAHTQVSRDLLEAARWIENSEGVWNQLIGTGTTTQLVQVSGPSWTIDPGCACWCDGQPTMCGDTPCGPQEPGPPDDECQNPIPDSSNPCWNYSSAEFAEVVIALDESDGFITAESQELPGSWAQEEITASHLAESTSGEMWEVVQKAITPGTEVHPVFRIPGCNL